MGPGYSLDGGPVLGVGGDGHGDGGGVLVHAGDHVVGFVDHASGSGSDRHVFLFHFLEYADNGVGVGLVMLVPRMNMAIVNNMFDPGGL